MVRDLIENEGELVQWVPELILCCIRGFFFTLACLSFGPITDHGLVVGFHAKSHHSGASTRILLPSNPLARLLPLFNDIVMKSATSGLRFRIMWREFAQLDQGWIVRRK